MSCRVSRLYGRCRLAPAGKTRRSCCLNSNYVPNGKGFRRNKQSDYALLNVELSCIEIVSPLFLNYISQWSLCYIIKNRSPIRSTIASRLLCPRPHALEIKMPTIDTSVATTQGTSLVTTLLNTRDLFGKIRTRSAYSSPYTINTHEMLLPEPNKALHLRQPISPWKLFARLVSSSA